MLTFNFYICIYLIIIWLVFVANSFYQNHKMKYYLPDKIIELLTIPFYILLSFTFFILTKNLAVVGLNKDLNILNPVNVPAYFQAIQILGAVFCLLSILLYIYVNFFEKSFPSCLAIKNKGDLNGIYNYVRHPSYYIFFLINFGTALCLLDKTIFILACINHISLYFYYLLEEKQIKKDNPHYADYLKKTKRFFPVFNKTDN